MFMVNGTITSEGYAMFLDRLRLLALITALAAVTACAPNAAQEKFGKVYGGLAQTDGDDIEAERLVSFDPTKQSKGKVEYDYAFAVEGRPGIWFNEWGGIALDGSYLQASGNGINNTIVSATPLLLLRARLLKSDAVPDGQLQSYFGIGPGVFFLDQEIDFRPNLSSKLDTTHISVGLDVRAGMRWQLSRNLGIFGEYRLTRYNTDGSNINNAIISSQEQVNSTLTTNHFMGGLSLVF
jgi:opacity protein-like surface antigen